MDGKISFENNKKSKYYSDKTQWKQINNKKYFLIFDQFILFRYVLLLTKRYIAKFNTTPKYIVFDT